MQRDAKAAISRRSFLKGRGMCPSCHDVEGNSAVRCNESLHDLAHLAGNENPQDCHSVHHLQSAKKCTAWQGVHWKLDASWEKKRTVWDLLSMTNSK